MKQPLGMLIKQIVDEQERSVTWFAGKLFLDRSCVYRIFRKNSIDTELLMRISVVLNHDFFADLSRDFTNRQISQQK